MTNLRSLRANLKATSDLWDLCEAHGKLHELEKVLYNAYRKGRQDAERYSRITLKEARERAGISDVEASKYIGVSVQTLRNYETGKEEIRTFEAMQLSELYGCTIDELEWI